jgi:small subunit ribosomal protein S9
MATKKNSKKTTVKSTAKDYYVQAVGRRRTASARIRVYPNSDRKGEIEVNNKPISQYFPGVLAEKHYNEPLRTCNAINKYFISARISGSGTIGQLEAFIHALSRALVRLDNDTFRPILKKRNFLTRDPRMRERRKVGMGGKARRKRQSPRR